MSRRTPGIRTRTNAAGQKRYQARYETHLGREVAATFDTLREAQAWLRDVKSAAHRGGALPASRLLRRKTVDELWSDVLEERGGRWSPTTAARYTNIYDKRVQPVFGRAAAAKVTRTDVRQWAKSLTAEGLSPSSVRQAITVLSLICGEAAIEQGIRVTNPTTHTRPRTTLTKDRQHFDAETLGRLLNVATSDTDRAAWALMGVGGLRFGEAAGLQVQDIDLDAGHVRVERVIIAPGGKLAVKDYPKGGETSRRVIGIGTGLADLIRPATLGRDADDWLWPNRLGGPQRYRAARVRVDRALDEIREPRAGFHALRRSSATLALQQGASPRDVMAQLGHTSPSMTLGVYARPDVNRQQQTSDAVTDAMQSSDTRTKSGQDA